LEEKKRSDLTELAKKILQMFLFKNEKKSIFWDIYNEKYFVYVIFKSTF